MSSFRCALRRIALFSLACGLIAPGARALQNAAAPPTTQSSVVPTISSLPSPAVDTVVVPGPLRSFLRMASISQQARAADVLPLLARNVYQNGYSAKAPTEFLLLIERYLTQARELQALAGADHTIRVADCAGADRLLFILGYQLRHGCNGVIATETKDPERAFLTVDSGFPLTELEEALQGGVPFTYPYASFSLPVLFHKSDWVALGAPRLMHSNDLLDAIFSDPAVARLYFGMSKMDAATATYLSQALRLKSLLAMATAVDFYGSQISVRSGRVLVPGGAAAEPAWQAVVGASPAAPAEFVARLLARDRGWLLAYFDVLSRASAEQQRHLTAGTRLLRNYEAFHLADPKESAANGMLRPASELLVLDTRLLWDADGNPHVPGTLETWKGILRSDTHNQVDRTWARRAQDFDRPDQLIEALTAFSRTESTSGPVQLYLSLCEMDRRRPLDRQLSPATVSLLASKSLAPKSSMLNSWYLLFSEFPALDDASIAQFLESAEAVDRIHADDLRANALGSLQANVGLWAILARQHEISAPSMNAAMNTAMNAALNTSWRATVQPFAKVTSSVQLFDATRASLRTLLASSGGNAGAATAVGVTTLSPPGEQAVGPGEIVDRLAGPVQAGAAGQRIHGELAARLQTVLDDQQLVSLDTLFALSDGLETMEKTGKPGGDELVALAGELRNFDIPHSIFTHQEKTNWAPGVYKTRHAELRVQTDLVAVLQAHPANTSAMRARLEAARGQLAPYLRDTLVGLNYAFYEPPGAQILHINPLFVRAHDFLGLSVVGKKYSWQPPVLMGAGVSAGGGAYLMGSLADLPYALASAEQDFIVPEKVQALIWRELVPGLIADATVPRWWGVSPQEMHAAALYQRAGEELARSAGGSPTVRLRLLQLLNDRMSPQRLGQLEAALLQQTTLDAAVNHLADHLADHLLPSDTFYLTEAYRRSFPGEADAAGPANRELTALIEHLPVETDAAHLTAALAADFGVSHPTLAATNGRELLHLQPFPYCMGSTNRLFSESLESENLYWARLADDMGYDPVALNRLVPELTRRMVGKIFASNVEDWPAVLRAMQETGDEVRATKPNAVEAFRSPAPAMDAVKAAAFGQPALDGPAMTGRAIHGPVIDGHSGSGLAASRQTPQMPYAARSAP